MAVTLVCCPGLGLIFVAIDLVSDALQVQLHCQVHIARAVEDNCLLATAEIAAASRLSECQQEQGEQECVEGSAW